MPPLPMISRISYLSAKTTPSNGSCCLAGAVQRAAPSSGQTTSSLLNCFPHFMHIFFSSAPVSAIKNYPPRIKNSTERDLPRLLEGVGAKGACCWIANHYYEKVVSS